MSETAERLARIETHVGAILEDQAELRAYLIRVLERQEVRLRGVELDHASTLPRINILHDAVGTLRKRAYAWDALNTMSCFRSRIYRSEE
ncbi:MAG: hypothetical protein KAT00_01335, partial [Planctomycetes bacterium]|nr:hypothetical protein [Planctomycetota bacterium]